MTKLLTNKKTAIWQSNCSSGLIGIQSPVLTLIHAMSLKQSFPMHSQLLFPKPLITFTATFSQTTDYIHSYFFPKHWLHSQLLSPKNTNFSYGCSFYCSLWT